MRITSSRLTASDSSRNHSLRARVEPTVRCTARPARSAARSASRHVLLIRRRTKQNGLAGSGGRGAAPNQRRLSCARRRRAWWIARHARCNCLARASNCTGVQLEVLLNRYLSNRSCLPMPVESPHASRENQPRPSAATSYLPVLRTFTPRKTEIGHPCDTALLWPG